MDIKPTKIKDEKKYYDKATVSKKWSSGDLRVVKDFIIDQTKDCDIKLLEVGCGEATILNEINDIKYVGIDPSEHCIKKNKEKENDNYKFKQALAEKLPEIDASFDIVFSDHALEHFSDPKKAILEMLRVLKNKGYLILMAPNHDLPWTKVNAVRHYGKIRKNFFIFTRVFLSILRIFSILPFYVINDNYTTVTKKFERPDDDLVYLTSAYEVAELLKKNNCKIVKYPKFNKVEKNMRVKIKVFLMKFKVFKYANNDLFFIVQKIEL